MRLPLACALVSISPTCMFRSHARGTHANSHLENSSVLLNNALLLWAFNIKEDPSSPIDPTAFRSSIITRPLPFSVIFEPRAAETAGGIRELLNDYGL